MTGLRSGLLGLLLMTALAGCTRAPVADQPVADQPVTTTTRPSAPPSTAVTTSVPATSPARSSAVPASTHPTSAAPSPSAKPIAPVSAQAQAAGLIDIRTIVPDAIIDLRYATSHNFVGVVLYPPNARCLIHQSMAPGLTTAANALRRQGFQLVFWDCYRPHPVQVHMFQIVPDSNWVARPGPYATSHEAGRSVDVTLAHAAPGWRCAPADQVQHRCLLDMGTGFDDFTARAHAFASYGVSAQAQSNRALLRAAMNLGGIVVYSGEWWHFDGPGSLVERPILDAPVY
ncbi:MAG: M15 family metallopeptidase [Jatrophihabitantaceae bacterium]